MEWFSLLPPVVAIVIALWKKEVILALGAAIFCAELLLINLNPVLAFLNTLDRVVAVFDSRGNTEILIFSLLIGALLALIRESGGVSAFVDFLFKKNIATSPRRVSLITCLMGMVIFIESNLSVLTAGIFAQPLFDKFKLSRARLAYLIDSTCSPVSVLILLNGWGAYILGLLEGYGLENPVRTMIFSIPFNFYALLTLAVVFYTATSNKVFFNLATFEESPPIQSTTEPNKEKSKKRYFLFPLIFLTFGIVVFMFITGNGEILNGSGSASVLYSTVIAIVILGLLQILDKRKNYTQLIETSFKGMGELLPLVTVVLLAFALGGSMQALGTGSFIASMISESLPFWSIASLVFLSAALISFCTGTSWGTFAILIPIAIPVAISTGLPPSLLLAATLGGGVFGDHCSPISDSTILSSLASGCDHLTHVKTQLPYSLLVAVITMVLFVITSLFI